MGLGNLYFDVSFLNPFKKRAGNGNPTKVSYKLPAQSVSPEKKELPEVSKRLLDPSLLDKKVAVEPQKIVSLAPPPEMKAEPKIVEMKAERHRQHQAEPDESAKSFFSNLSRHLVKEENYLHTHLPRQVLEKNLFAEMQTFWNGKKEGMDRVLYNKAIKTDLMDKIEELQALELEWQKLQLEHERLKDQLASKEILIDNHIKQMKKTFKKMHLSSDINPEYQFILSNGVKIKNLYELHDNLKDMDPQVFSHHVNPHKNDFATWVHDVMGLSELAENMKKAESREELGRVVEEWAFKS
ncbi:MAG: hypothetical protein HGA85_06715 [Nanoarchaeota archaeon]|nr:hypothetical protein [Nanoarchaeota archaeon]